MSQALLEVKNLKVYYPVKVRKNALASEKRFVKAVDDISFSIRQGETFGLVGESGCGKSTTGKTIVRLLKPAGGQVLFEGQDIFAEGKKSDLSQKIQIIFQDPYSSLDPRFTVGRCIAEPMRVHKMGTAKEQEERVRSLMHDVGLRPEAYTKYPHEFSGGQRQRIGVARALALNPSLIVCDEPVSALDVSIQAHRHRRQPDLLRLPVHDRREHVLLLLHRAGSRSGSACLHHGNAGQRDRGRCGISWSTARNNHADKNPLKFETSGDFIITCRVQDCG